MDNDVKPIPVEVLEYIASNRGYDPGLCERWSTALGYDVSDEVNDGRSERDLAAYALAWVELAKETKALRIWTPEFGRRARALLGEAMGDDE